MQLFRLDIPVELDPDNPFIPDCVTNACEIDDSVPTFEEVTACLRRNFKLNKAPGSDGIFNENLILAVDCPKFMRLFYSMVMQVWAQEDIPETWRESIITLLYKKGKDDDPKNFRPLSLIHCVSKIITKIVRRRMFKRYEQIISGDQFGFRQGCGTIDAIYIFRQLIKCKKGPVFCLFLDLRGAFDRLPRKIMFRILEIMLGNQKFTNIFTKIHTRTTAKIKDGTELFELKAGVRQGSDEGPNVFNIFFEYVLLVCEKAIKDVYPDYGVEFKFNILSESDSNSRGNFTGPKYGADRLRKMQFADDLVFFAKSALELQNIMDIVTPIFDKFGLILAEDKTKVMAFNLPESEPEPKITVSLPNLSTPYTLEFVDIFRYLGHSVSSKSSSLFLNAQKEAAWSAFNSNSKVLTNKSIKLKTRTDLLDSLVRSIMLYSSQAVDLTKRQKDELEALYRKFLRKMVFRTWKRSRVDDDGNYHLLITNDDLQKLTNTVPIEKFVEKQFLKFQAHITRLPNNSIQKKLQFATFERKISKNLWSNQVRWTMQNKSKFYSDIDSRFGTRRAKRRAIQPASSQVPELAPD